VTSRLFDHPVRATFEVLLELALIRASVLLSSQFRSTLFTSTEVVYGVADPDVTALPESGVVAVR